MSIWRYADWLSPCDLEHRISLGEGNTPLIRSRRIGPALGLERLFFKVETTNPTGSYKDRFAAAAISDLLANGKTRCVSTSSGNTGSALAAYCAAANVTCELAIIITAPEGKLRQMEAYGADLYKVEDFGLDPEITKETFELIKQDGSAADAQMHISAFCYSPIGMTGVQTLGYELAEASAASDPAIDHVFSCSGGGGLTLAVARGLARAAKEGLIHHSPAVHCVQPEGNNTIAGPLRQGQDQAQPCECTTSVSGLQVASVLDGHDVITACRASGGTGHLVDDESVWQCQQRLAREEGIFCEPAAAVPLAGALRAYEEGLIPADAGVVCLVTGSGFKDEAALDRMIADQQCPTITLDQMRQKRHSS